MERIGETVAAVLDTLRPPTDEGDEMTVTPQADQEIVVGVVQGIVQKAADKWQIEVNIGQQNPRRLWTKDAGLVQTMATMIGQQLSFMCGQSHWTNASGQPVTSLWINGYGAPGAVQDPTVPTIQQPQFQQQQPAQFVQQQPVMQQPMAAPVQQVDTREQKIHRQTATKVAVDLMRFLHPEDQNFTNLIKLSERLVAYYDNGVPPGWTGQNPDGAGASGGSGPADGGYGPTPPHDDDSIPF